MNVISQISVETVKQAATVVVQQPIVKTVQVQLGSAGRSNGSSQQQFTDLLPSLDALSALRVARYDIELLTLRYADCSDASQAFQVLGLLTMAVSSGGAIPILVGGLFSDDAWNWDTTRPIFLGTAGLLTQNFPKTGFLLQVARAITPKQIHFEIQEPVIL